MKTITLSVVLLSLAACNLEQRTDVKTMPKEEVMSAFHAGKTESVTTSSKVIAPLIQGKGDIRSEPKNSPKQGMMLKASLGDVVAGKKMAKKCASCHTFNQGGKKKTGPNLFGIVGKAKGADPKYKYGTYLKDIGGVWDEASLRSWLKDSKGVAKAAGKRTKMASQKINGKQADDLIAYLQTLQ